MFQSQHFPSLHSFHILFTRIKPNFQFFYLVMISHLKLLHTNINSILYLTSYQSQHQLHHTYLHWFIHIYHNHWQKLVHLKPISYRCVCHLNSTLKLNSPKMIQTPFVEFSSDYIHIYTYIVRYLEYSVRNCINTMIMILMLILTFNFFFLLLFLRYNISLL